jgi:hypothetical protein
MQLLLLLFGLLACAEADATLSVSVALTDCSNSSSLVGGFAVRATLLSCVPAPCTDGVVSKTTCVPYRDTLTGLFPKGFVFQAYFASADCTGLSQVRFFAPRTTVDYGIYSQEAACVNGGLNLTSCNKVFGRCTSSWTANGCVQGVLTSCQ